MRRMTAEQQADQATHPDWPPKTGDLWRDRDGDLWFAVRTAKGIVFRGGFDIPLEPSRLMADWSPLVLVRREPKAGQS